jgi:hypothetical protein
MQSKQKAKEWTLRGQVPMVSRMPGRLDRWIVRLLVATLLFGGSLARAVTLCVPAEYLTIVAAMDVATAGDTVLVSPGTYVEELDYSGKDVVVRARPFGGRTVISGTVRWESGEGPGAILEGFFIEGEGPLLVVDRAAPLLRWLTIVAREKRCVRPIHLHGAAARLEQVLVSRACSGALLATAADQSVIERCVFDRCGPRQIWDRGNLLYRGGALLLEEGSQTLVQDCLFGGCAADKGGAIAIEGATARVLHSRFLLNRASLGGALCVSSGGVLDSLALLAAPPLVGWNLFAGNLAVPFWSTDASLKRSGRGGSVALESGPAVLWNNTLVSSHARPSTGPGGQAAIGSTLFTGVHAWGEVNANIFMRAEGAPAWVAHGPSIAETNELFWGNFSGNWSGWSGPGRGRLMADPLFLDPVNGDFRIPEWSPAVDAGPHDSLDADYSTRDIGAFIWEEEDSVGVHMATAQPILPIVIGEITPVRFSFEVINNKPVWRTGDLVLSARRYTGSEELWRRRVGVRPESSVWVTGDALVPGSLVPSAAILEVRWFEAVDMLVGAFAPADSLTCALPPDTSVALPRKRQP